MQEKHSASRKFQAESGKVAFLARHDIFQQLQSSEIDELERVTTLLACPPGRVFYRPGEVGSLLFLLKSGRVQLYHLSTDGRKLITATLEAGACFGELPLLSQQSHQSFAEAVEETQLYVISKSDMEQLLLRKPQVTLALLRRLEQRVLHLETQLINTTFKGSTARLATLLLHLAQPNTQKTLEVTGFSHEELAEHLGVYRETVSTALRELKEEGAIEPGRKHIIISSPERLAEIASRGNKSGRS